MSRVVPGMMHFVCKHIIIIIIIIDSEVEPTASKAKKTEQGNHNS